MKKQERPSHPNVSGPDHHGNHPHGSPGAFELKLTGPAVWLLAGGVAAVLYQLAARLGG
jgi:hypothetical protein